MGGYPQVFIFRLEDGKKCGPRVRVAQYPDAILATKEELVFGFEVAGLSALQLIKRLRPT
jgi:hypothetical protein